GERCRLISFDHDLLRLAASSSLRLGVLVTAARRERLLPVAREVRAAALHTPFAIVDRALVEAAQAEGFLVNAWTVNTEEEVRRLAALGVNEITTDYPELVRRTLEGTPG